MKLIDADEIVYESIDSSDTEEYFAKYGTGILAVRKEDIDKMPAAEPHWIPVTEDPIPDGEYLVTWTSEIQEKPILSIMCRYSGEWECFELKMLGHQDINVLAYMELPEPYKGVTE